MSVWKLSNGPDSAVNFSSIDWATNTGDLFNPTNLDTQNDLLTADPREIRRAETAPMILTIMAVDGSLCVGGLEKEVAPGEEYRYAEEYHRLYYSKTPRDPRMLPPLTRHRAPKAPSTNHDPTTSPTPKVGGAIGEGVGAATKDPEAKTPVLETDSPPTAEPTTAPRLTEYIEASRPEWDYAAIKGHIFEFSRDQDGSRLVQRLIEKLDNLVEITNEVFADFEALTTDVFGNYVVQKLFDVVSHVEFQLPPNPKFVEARLLEKLTEQIRGKLKKYSFQTYSCRAMQRALENLRDTDRDQIILELDGCVMESVLDQNASHVVQKIIEVCPSKCQFLVDAFLPHLNELACHAYGCRVLQRTFEKCHAVNGVNIRPLLEAVIDRISEFTIHQYGNYVVQHGMLNAPEDLRHSIVMQLMPQMYALSCSKFASNVAEKVVVTANSEERDVLITYLTKSLGENQGGNYLVHMMQDTYGNYVVQRFLEVSSPAQRTRIGEIVMPYVESINQSVYGRHMLRRIETMGILPREILRKQGMDLNAPEYGGLVTTTTNNTKNNSNKNISSHSGGNDARHSSNGNNHRNTRRTNNNTVPNKRSGVNQQSPANLNQLSNLVNNNNVIPVPQLATTYSPHPFVTMQSYMPMRGYAPYTTDPLYSLPQSQKTDFISNPPPQPSFSYPAAMYATTTATNCPSHTPFFVNGGYPASTQQPSAQQPAPFIGLPPPSGGPAATTHPSNLAYYSKPMYVDGGQVMNCNANILNSGSADSNFSNSGHMNGVEGYQGLSQPPQPNMAGVRWCK
ncbi:unnamed protein product [Phytomonas sp. Hart1]|nr:unnamed protein product [Phytomonas sp. Hart1]|eukprot:CCW69587.1 unnamed protein product [Phytomonas sp. isolate Hart1]